MHCKQLELVRIILDENPETVSQRDKKGKLPLHLAMHYDSALEIVEAVYSIYPTAALLMDHDGELKGRERMVNKLKILGKWG